MPSTAPSSACDDASLAPTLIAVLGVGRGGRGGSEFGDERGTEGRGGRGSGEFGDKSGMEGRNEQRGVEIAHMVPSGAAGPLGLTDLADGLSWRYKYIYKEVCFHRAHCCMEQYVPL